MTTRRRKSHQQPATVRRIKALQLAPSEWGVASGYGRAAFEIASALKALGVEVGSIGRPKLMGEAPDLPVFSEDTFVPEAIIHIGEPPTWKMVEGKRNIGLCWWPYSKIPTAWYRYLHGIEKLIVPSAWCACGAVMPNPNQTVNVVPLGVDASRFTPYKRERSDTLRFLVFAASAGDYAVGADVAALAFAMAFPGDRRHDVALDIWTTQLADVDAPDSRIRIRRHIGGDADLVRLYHRYDALIASARGSGFGLVPIECMATGMPVFHSGQGGFEQIADFGTLIGARRRPTMRVAHEDAECFEPLYEVLGKRMQQLDSDYDTFQEKAMSGAALVTERFTWEHTAKAILNALEG